MQTHLIKTTPAAKPAHPRPDLHVVDAQTGRNPAFANTMGFSRRELRRLVAEMID